MTSRQSPHPKLEDRLLHFLPPPDRMEVVNGMGMNGSKQAKGKAARHLLDGMDFY
jgi:hypothetical protein